MSTGKVAKNNVNNQEAEMPVSKPPRYHHRVPISAVLLEIAIECADHWQSGKSPTGFFPLGCYG